MRPIATHVTLFAWKDCVKGGRRIQQRKEGAKLQELAASLLQTDSRLEPLLRRVDPVIQIPAFTFGCVGLGWEWSGGDAPAEARGLARLRLRVAVRRVKSLSGVHPQIREVCRFLP